MMGCCGCCSALRPRYKRLVDNVFPVNADDGLVKSNMEKLTFYSVSSPEKLDRIGEYLYQKASKDINRKRYKLVEIAMEAMDLLLVACHAQTLNLFVESFLRMVQKLLEDSNATLQILATNSFVKFANIEEDTPSYHRRYDFFISKFSSMCHSSHDDRDLCTQLRMAGIRGLQGVIRKTVSDDLVENIWDRQHMEKIVPSLLYNMQTAETAAVGSPSARAIAAATTTTVATAAVTANGSGTSSSPSSSLYSSAIAVPCNSGDADLVGGEDSSATATPPALAESVLRELVSRASFTHIKSVLNPLLQHLDRHELWVPNQFAIHTFRIVMISIQPQYSYTVVETLMQHLDQNMKSSPRTKTSLAVVLSKIIAIAAGESVGPSALDIINNLLTHLRTSTLLAQSQAQSGTAMEEEDHYQEALINALGEFANHHPDYQKIEIMLFIMNTVPDMAKSGPADLRLQLILLRSLRRVSIQYRTIHFEKAFPASFRQPLLRMARAPHVEIRMIVMQILQALLDRHDNQAEVLQVVGRMAEVGRGGGALTGGGGLGLTNSGAAVAASAAAVLAELSLESPSRSDIMFARKHGAVMMQALIDAMALDDTRDGMRATWRTTALLVVELGCGETIQEFLLFVLGIEKLAITMPADAIGYAHRCNLHTVAITLLGLLGHVTGVNNLREYCAKLMDARAADAPHWLHAELLDPAAAQSSANAAERRPLNQPHLYIDQLALVECLQNADMESGRLAAGTPYTLHQADAAGHRHSWVGDTTSVSVSGGVQRSGRTSLDDITGASFNGSTSAATSGGAELDSSVNSSPVLPRRQAITVELNFDAMKRALAEPTEAAKREVRERSAQLGRVFREASFDELLRRTEPKHDMLQNRLNDLFTALAVERQIQAQSELKLAAASAGVQPLLAAAMAGVSVGGGGMAAAAAAAATGRERPIYEQSFPELFYY